MINPVGRISGVLLTLAVAALPAPSIAHISCEALENLSLPETVVISAHSMPAGPLNIPPVIAVKDCESTVVAHAGAPCAGVAGTLPEFCRVTLRVEPQIYIEVWLPAERAWNGRFVGVGGGGYAGWINYGDLALSLRAGSATASTDTGHPFYMEGTFAIRADGSLNRQLLGDFASRSVHEMVLKAKSLIRSYYGVPPKYSYWNSCSTGGRQGLVAVQRFPEEYDGVLAGSPAINWDRLLPSILWPQLAVQWEVGHAISPRKLDRVTRDAIAACDRDDGVIDGVIGDPRSCKYNPAESVCRDQSQSNECLTVAEANAIRRIWDGPKSAGTGEQLWFGYERGTNLTQLVGLNTEQMSFATNYFRDMIRQDRSFDWRTVDLLQFERDIRSSYAKFNQVIGTDDPNLRAWKERGGKLLIWQDEGDEIIPPRGILNYFGRVLAANGGAADVRRFARLYMVPGSSHCGVSEAPWDDRAHLRHRMFDALVEWVEHGRAPESVVTFIKGPDGGVSTRPICPYPGTAKWAGEGNSHRAENFACEEGAHNARDFKVMKLDGE